MPLNAVAVELVSVAASDVGGIVGSAWPLNVSPSLGDAAPTEIGCVCSVPRHGASCIARSDGNISP